MTVTTKDLNVSDRQCCQWVRGGDQDAARESANDHQRFGSEVDSSGPEHMSEEGVDLEEEDAPEDIVVEVEPVRPAAVRAALVALDAIQLPEWLKKRPSVMKSVPHCVKGPFRNALRQWRKQCPRRICAKREGGNC